MGDDLFQLVTSKSRLDEILRELRRDLPNSACIHNLLLTHALGYVSFHDLYELRTPTPVPVILTRRKENQAAVSLYCRESDVHLLTDALSKTVLIDWTNPFFFVYLPSYLEGGIMALVESRSRGRGELFNLQTFAFLRGEELEGELRCPPGVRVCHLGEAGVRQMHAAWQHNKHIDLNTLLSLGQHSTTIGVYERENEVAKTQFVELRTPLCRASDDEEPMSWVALMPYGFSGMLHTEESHRRKGLARLAMKVFSRVMYEQGLVPVAFVEEDNETSFRLFCGLPGWRKVLPTFNMAVNCKGTTFRLD